MDFQQAEKTIESTFIKLFSLLNKENKNNFICALDLCSVKLISFGIGDREKIVILTAPKI